MDRVSIGPQVYFGKPCIRGTRIWVSLIPDVLASGESEDDILARYPELEPDDIRAARACTVEVARQRVAPIDVSAAERNSNLIKTSAISASICLLLQGRT